MKFMTLIAGIFLSLSAHAEGLVLLNCTTMVGPDQQVTVYQKGTQLLLVESSPSGREYKRWLDSQEWSSQKLKLREELGATTTLSKTRDGWMIQSVADGFQEVGYAQCD